MPKRQLSVAAFVLAMPVAAACLAQSPPEGPDANEDFVTAKARHVARLKEELACAEAAATLDALRACRPKPPGGHGGPPPGQ